MRSAATTPLPTSAEADTATRVRQSHEAALRTLRAVSSHVDASCDLPSFFGLLSKTVAGLVHARRAAFWRLEPDNVLVVQPEPYGFAPGALEAIRTPLDPTGSSKPARVVFHDDVRLGAFSGTEFDEYRAVLDRMGVRNSVAVSWRTGDTILGGLAAYDADREFDDQDAWILRIAAGTAALVWQYKQTEAGLKDTVDRLGELAEERRQLLRDLVTVSETERRRLANDIHDDALQALTGVDLRLHRLRARTQHPGQRRLLDDAADMLARADDSLRRLLFDVGPPSLELPGGFEAAIRSRLELLRGATGVDTRLELQLASKIGSDAAQRVFRIVHGALTNVAKHSQAHHVIVSLKDEDGGIRGCVRDDGVGFSPAAIRVQPGHIGLAAMQQRAEQAGGWLRLDNASGSGTTVDFWVPGGSP